MGWLKAAEGTDFDNLEQLIADRELAVGTELRAEMEVGFWDFMFDVAGAEQVFSTQVPDGVWVKDVWGDNGRAYVSMEIIGTGVSMNNAIAGINAGGRLLSRIVSWIAANWGLLVVGTIVIATVVSFIWLYVNVPAVAAIPITLIVGISIGIVGLTLLQQSRPQKQKT